MRPGGTMPGTHSRTCRPVTAHAYSHTRWGWPNSHLAHAGRSRPIRCRHSTSAASGSRSGGASTVTRRAPSASRACRHRETTDRTSVTATVNAMTARSATAAHRATAAAWSIPSVSRDHGSRRNRASGELSWMPGMPEGSVGVGREAGCGSLGLVEGKKTDMARRPRLSVNVRGTAAGPAGRSARKALTRSAAQRVSASKAGISQGTGRPSSRAAR
jgi:hypothetical protein